METENDLSSRVSGWWLGSSSSVTAVVVLVAVVTMAMQAVIIRKRNKNSKSSSSSSSSKQMPPTCPVSTKEFFANFFGPDSPRYVMEISRQMGEPIYRLPTGPFGPAFFVVTDYRVARNALEHPKTTKFHQAGQFFRDTTHGGANMVTEEGHRWKHVRKATSNAFSGQNIKLMVETIGVIVDKWIKETLEPAIESNQNIDILGEMNTITSNVIAQVAFDYEFTDEEREKTLRNLETCWIEFGQKSFVSLLRQSHLTRWMFPGIRKAQQAAKEMYHLCQKMLDEYRTKKEKQPHKIIHLIAQDQEYKDDGERIRDMIAYVIAGFDTTANTLAFAFRELALYPEEQAKLRAAIRACASQEEARNCPALKQVVRETLRMYPAAAGGSIRQLGSDIAVPGSTYILPSGNLVLTPYYAIQRNQEVYKDADSFVPSRWENPSEAEMRCLMTFSAGRRNCQGQALANAELIEVLAKLCGKYEFSVVEEGRPYLIVLYKPVGTILSAKVAT